MKDLGGRERQVAHVHDAEPAICHHVVEGAFVHGDDEHAPAEARSLLLLLLLCIPGVRVKDSNVA